MPADSPADMAQSQSSSHHHSSGFHPFRSIKHHLEGHDHDGDHDHDRNGHDKASDVPQSGEAQQATQQVASDIDAPTESQRQSIAADEARMNPHKDRGGQAAEVFQGRSADWRTVQDPITRAPLRQRDVTEQDYRRGLDQSDSVQDGIRVPQPGATSQSHNRDDDKATPKDPSEIPEHPAGAPSVQKGGSALIYQLPTTAPSEGIVSRVFRSMARTEAVLFAGWSVLSLATNPRISTALTLAAGGVFGGWIQHLVYRRVIDGLRDNELERERRRGQAVDAAKVPESAEWLNSFLKVLWPQINSEMFDGIADTLEDVLQASLPAFVNSVKVSEITQGTTSLRILAVRRLPDGRKVDKSSPKQKHKMDGEKHASEAAQQLGLVDESKREIEEAIKANERKPGEPLALDEEEDDGAEYINLEIAFAYRPPAHTGGDPYKVPIHKRTSAHMLLSFFVKTGVVNAPIPVNVSLRGLVGTLRIRIQLTSQAPFLGKSTLSFVGLPRVEIDAAPLRAVSIMDVPVISKFVQNAIDAAMATYTAPGSLDLDLSQLISGDDIKREIAALGAIVIFIESAEAVERSDALFGSSDPYVTVSFSRYGKVLYCTRVVLDDLNPRWHEYTAILLHPEVVKAGERVALELRDSDRTSSDDLLGRAEVSLTELLQNPGELIERTDELKGDTPGSKRGGRITWRAGYYPKAPVNTKLSRFEQILDVGNDGAAAKDDGRDSKGTQATPKPIEEELLHRAEKAGKVPVEYTPPDPSLPSGILSVTVHQIAALDVPQRSESKVRRRKLFEPGQEVHDEIGDASPEAPSSYVEVLICDALVYRTRTKMQSRAPIFQAGTERFVRDWQTSTVVFAVREARINEADPIIGVVALRLEALFRDKSQSTDWYPISGGIGSGRIRLSVLFRSVDCRLERPLRGFDIGTVQVHDAVTLHSVDAQTRSDLGGCYLKLRTIAGKASISSTASSKHSGGTGDDAVVWTLSDKKNPLRLPVHRRHASALLVEWRAKNQLRKTTVWAVAAVWLTEIADSIVGGSGSGSGSDTGGNKVATIQVPVWDGKDAKVLSRLKQNFQSFHDASQGEALGGKRVATLELKLGFRAGIDRTHTKFAAPRPDTRAAMEAWRASAASSGTEAMAQAEIEEQYGGGGGGDTSSDSSDSSDSSSDNDDEDESGDEVGGSGRRGMLRRMNRDRKEKEEWTQIQDGSGARELKPVRMVDQLKEKAMDTVEKVKSELDTSKNKLGGQVETEV
ncbi:uncharacterized protein PFL1_05042 [Pseudozyma flocculosa PF-1]|uniref:C2 domain-containing protein n=2 Tax=Pseudozyma flocculosa TaxID=84751 RepID=A0A5C3EYD5_9BASI|nr:uncharacterized protein PFL1_05042 [Pseudozyma flocculosa PF-1]EPQ27504.1 hypothetical protein PFL1_05042 [Pseudozyma flocculosa PF-1]SPO36061.1 uncharacterized protein PSFLO_01532 [Pseudozyma flocculosa]